MIDGSDIKSYDLSSLRRQIGYVGQEPVLFAMTIKENLLLVKPDASLKELEEALKIANAYDFVMALEKKLDTYVGTGGSQLSGGQK
jgi:ABC-type multidrug transport system fused ATPase/permease subunit